MEINKFNKAMSWLTRPSRKIAEDNLKKELAIGKETKVEGSKILKWINYNNKVYGNDSTPVTDDERKTGEEIEKFADQKQLEGLRGRLENARQYATPPKAKTKKDEKGWRYTSWADGQKDIEEMKVKDKPQKKVIKKTLIVEKPKPTIQEQLDFQDHLNTLDPYWWIEDEEETKPKVLIREPRRTAQGIQTILNPHKGRRT